MVVRGATYERIPLDLYETPTEATYVLLDKVRFRTNVVDPCRGGGKIVRVLRKFGYEADGSDITRGFDFLCSEWRWPGADIVTNPPFGPGGRTAVQFVLRALAVTRPHRGKVAMLLPVDFDSGKTRAPIFGEYSQFKMKIVLLNRIRWFDGVSGASNHCWCLWDHRHEGPPIIQYALQEYKT